MLTQTQPMSRRTLSQSLENAADQAIRLNIRVNLSTTCFYYIFLDPPLRIKYQELNSEQDSSAAQQAIQPRAQPSPDSQPRETLPSGSKPQASHPARYVALPLSHSASHTLEPALGLLSFMSASQTKKAGLMPAFSIFDCGPSYQPETSMPF
jgi:hypothetical protein